MKKKEAKKRRRKTFKKMTLDEAKAVCKQFTHPKPWYYLSFSNIRLVHAANSIDSNIYVVDVDREIYFILTQTPTGPLWTIRMPLDDNVKIEASGGSEREAWDALQSNITALQERIKKVCSQSNQRAREKRKMFKEYQKAMSMYAGPCISFEEWVRENKKKES